MTDAQRRELERGALTGDIDAEVHLLLTRVRLAELSEERLGLAALLGYAPARRASAACSPLEPSLPKWCEAIEEHGDVVFARALAAVARHAAAQLPTAERVADGLAALDEVAVSSALASSATTTLDETAQAIATHWAAYNDPSDRVPAPLECRLEVVILAVCSVTRWRAMGPGWRESFLFTFGPNAPELSLSGTVRQIAALEAIDSDELRAAITAELLPWALGHADPVAERLGTRGADRRGLTRADARGSAGGVP